MFCRPSISGPLIIFVYQYFVWFFYNASAGRENLGRQGIFVDIVGGIRLSDQDSFSCANNEVLQMYIMILNCVICLFLLKLFVGMFAACDFFPRCIYRHLLEDKGSRLLLR